MTDQNLAPVVHNPTLTDVKQWIVLLVDDEPDNRTIAETVLSFSGAKVHTATHGVDGLKLLESIVMVLPLPITTRSIAPGFSLFGLSKMGAAEPSNVHDSWSVQFPDL